MRAAKVWVIARREFVTRIRTKGFWIGTIALPALFGALIFLPTLLLARTETRHRVVLVDETGAIGGEIARALEGSPDVPRAARFAAEVEAPDADSGAQRSALDRRVLAAEIDAWVWISRAGLDENRVEYHAGSVSNFLTQAILERRISDAVRRHRLTEAGYDADQVSELARSVDLATIKVSAEGSREERAEAGMVMAYVLFFLLYMILILYGQQVMNGVLEEKTSRVVEVVVSTVRPFDLMMGKLAGIGAVGLVQLAIWLGSIVALTTPAVVASVGWIPPELPIPTVAPSLLAHFAALFLLGYFVYATLYAAIGAAFNNVQEAQQFASVAVIFLVAPLVLFPAVLNDPDSAVAVAASLVPLFTPLLMMLRIAVKEPPLGQILLSYALTAAFAVFMVWACGRIYRVGILMYGKKPTVKELWRWVRYA